MTQQHSTPDGLVIVDKPSGFTSHDVVAKMRGIARTRRVGHAGTLDPMATGVLVLGVEKATKLLGHLALTEKEYLGTVRLGQTTLTDDAEGEITASADASRITRDAPLDLASCSLVNGNLHSGELIYHRNYRGRVTRRIQQNRMYPLRESFRAVQSVLQRPDDAAKRLCSAYQSVFRVALRVAAFGQPKICYSLCLVGNAKKLEQPSGQAVID